LIELLSHNLDYFRAKPVNIPKITILLDHGYHPDFHYSRTPETLSTNHDQDSVWVSTQTY